MDIFSQGKMKNREQDRGKANTHETSHWETEIKFPLTEGSRVLPLHL